MVHVSINVNQIYCNNHYNCLLYAALCAAQQSNDDRESHERSSGSSKSQAAQDRRIDILPAEDDDGMRISDFCLSLRVVLVVT